MIKLKIIPLVCALGLLAACRCHPNEPAPLDLNKPYIIQLPLAVLASYPGYVSDQMPDQTPIIWRKWIVGRWRFDKKPHVMEFHFLPSGVVLAKHFTQGQKPVMGRGRYSIQKDLTMYFSINGIRPEITPVAMADKDHLIFVIGDEAANGKEGLEMVVTAERIHEEPLPLITGN